ncbi:hypothetical protein ACTHGU_09030 [Chitinophagaceae bacterium MMS25-I14]
MLFISKLKKLLRLNTRAPDTTGETQPPQEPAEKPAENISLSQKQTETMSMFNYGVGGNEVKVDANEAIQEIQENKTLLVSKLTQDDSVNPEIITGLKTVDDVFRYFQPAIAVEHETADGQMVKEDFRFSTVADFTPKGITAQSAYLNELNLQQEQYNKIMRQLKANKVLRAMLENEETKAAFVNALKAVASEIETNK